MTGASRSGSKPKRDHRQTRLTNLQMIKVDGRKRIDEVVRANLRRWYDEGGTRRTHIEVRAAFLRRLHPLTPDELEAAGDIVDRPKPDLPRPPALAKLTAIPKGVALRTALTLLFLVQTQPRALRGGARVDIPVVRDDDHGFGLVDLIAVNATHTIRPDGGEFAATTATNRQRQIRSALAQLADLGLVSLPSGGGRGSPRYHDVRLHSEVGNVEGTQPPVYTPPKVRRTPTLTIPIEFFINGWVHALTSREIANWLMYRDLRTQLDPPKPSEDGSVPCDLRIAPRARLIDYDLTRATWDTHRNLEAFGLLDVWTDPRRRHNGTTDEGKWAQPHRFRLIDEGLDAPGLETVEAILKDTTIPLNL